MSTVIIGGGDKVRDAVTAMENASLAWTTPQRDNGHDLFAQVWQMLHDFTTTPQPPA